jgi:hypothetical protein
MNPISRSRGQRPVGSGNRNRSSWFSGRFQQKEIAMKRLLPIASLAAVALLGVGCVNDYGYDRPYYGYSQGYAAPGPGFGYYAPARYPAYGYGYPRYGYANPYYSPYSSSGPGITFSATFPQGG